MAQNIESEKKLESLLKSTVERDLKGWCLKLLSVHITGLPDRLCLLPGGRLFFAEIKTTKKKPRKIQLFVHEKLRNLGFQVYVIDTSSQISEILKTYKNE